ncbi:Lipase (class 3) [Musa troglodytarum]|uniref:Lipase (Class 3) n=2 Tax=Musa troglodytarum TaxID=320322 RepID=A0A9E7I421_9LILI|nr:Lipase (class 3) [Musa troglodytarum]
MLPSNGHLLLPSPSFPFCRLLTLRRYAEPRPPSSSFVATMAGNGMMDAAAEGGETCDFGYLILRPDGGGLVDLARFLVSGGNVRKFLRSSEEEDGGGPGPIPDDHRWVILVSILVRRIIAFLGKPMAWCGMLVEFLLNLLSLNGGLHGLLLSLLSGKATVPQRGSETFISAVGHLDSRVDLLKFDAASLRSEEESEEVAACSQVGRRAVMDLCMMASKLAYENDKVVADVVNNHWKAISLLFSFGCSAKDYQKKKSTQVFVLCDKRLDASIVLISFRGTEPFDPDDWNTDIDYSWYKIPKMGRIHMGFLEALGLGNRIQVSTLQFHLQGHSLERSYSDTEVNYDTSSLFVERKDESLEMDKEIAYYVIRSKLKELLHEHKKAKFIVTGHSLGGALAVLFPAVLLFHKEEELLKRLFGVYTFGQPRVGDQQFERFMEDHLCHPKSKYFRVVYCNDLVPRLPYDNKTFLYKHFGTCLYYDSLYVEQNVEEEPNRNYFGLRYLLSEHMNAVWELIRSLSMRYAYGTEYKENWFSICLRIYGLLMPGVSAHSPVNYINSIRLGRPVADTASF